jgi:hypothetical protein
MQTRHFESYNCRTCNLPSFHYSRPAQEGVRGRMAMNYNIESQLDRCNREIAAALAESQKHPEQKHLGVVLRDLQADKDIVLDELMLSLRLAA